MLVFKRFATILTVLTLVVVMGCSGKQKKPEDEQDVSSSIPEAVNADQNIQTGDSDSGTAMGLQTINFPYDSFTLDAGSKGKLKANADILKANGTVKIQVEGHCDQRGGIQYNIALGEKRANATKKYLEDLGITSDRITTISFGKEKLIDPGSSEEAHHKNRRANFVVTGK